LLRDFPNVKDRIGRIVMSASERNFADDVASAQIVLESGVPVLLLPQEAAADLRLDAARWRRVASACTPRTLQLQALYELWQGREPILADAAAVAMAASESEAAEIRTASVALDDRGKPTIAEGESNVRVVRSLRAEGLLDRIEKLLTQGEAVLPRQPPHRTQPIDRGKMPHRVHVAEDYETDIERRWWLAGIPASHGDAQARGRYCRGMLTMDFDDQQGDVRTMYRAVIFNPVPGPPMGKNPHLAFRLRLEGTDTLRVQIYSLSKGYHRCLSLGQLPQGRWLDLAVDMTQARRPDGSGGPLSEGERIDDIQFYADPRAELSIDDIVLYDAAPAGQQRPFPRKVHFTGWFDTGKQGAQWPGRFEIPSEGGFFGKAARAIADAKTGLPMVHLDLRDPRPIGNQVAVDFRYLITRGGPIRVALSGDKFRWEGTIASPVAGGWQQATLPLQRTPAGQDSAASPQGRSARELDFALEGEGDLLVDDVLLYEPDEP
jgi:hypothetical protein